MGDLARPNSKERVHVRRVDAPRVDMPPASGPLPAGEQPAQVHQTVILVNAPGIAQPPQDVHHHTTVVQMPQALPWRRRGLRRAVSVLGLLSLLLGGIACAGYWYPPLSFPRIPLDKAGILLGGLALLWSIVTGRTGSALPMLGLLVSLAALGLSRAPASLLSLVHARAVPQQPAAAPVAARSSPSRSTAPPDGGTVDVGKVINDLKHDLMLDAAPSAPLKTKTAAPAPSPEAVSAVAEARTKLAAAKAAADAKLTGNTDYNSAKATLDAADHDLSELRKTEPIGSAALADASRRRNEAWSNLKAITDAAEAKDPAVTQAETDLSAAEARLRASVKGN